MMTKASDKKITVFYDGLCHLCSREINHYKKMRGCENINFTDITSAEFDAKVEKLDPFAIHQTLHARDRDGKVKTGVDVFILIWSELPALKFLVPIAKTKPIYYVMTLFYSVFAKIRPMLPRKSCEDSPYCEVPPAAK